MRALALAAVLVLVASPVLAGRVDDPRAPRFVAVPDAGRAPVGEHGAVQPRHDGRSVVLPLPGDSRAPAERRRPAVSVPGPRLIVVARPASPSGRGRDPRVAVLSQRAGHRSSGVASWYDDGPGLYAAVHSYRWGDPRYRLRVCSGARCVTVTVRDFCQCYVGTAQERAIDLSPDAFRRLAPLSAGLVRVVIG